MLGLVVNIASIVVGSLIGVAAKKLINDNLSKSIITAIGLSLLLIGLKGAFNDANTIVIMLSFVIGTLIGAGIDIDAQIERGSQKLAARFTKMGDAHEKFDAALTFFLVSCMGAFTVAACFSAGMGDNTMMYVKSILDIVTALTMTAGMGIGVMYAAIPTLIFQGILIAFAGRLEPLLTDNMIAAMACAGSLITIALALNLIGATKLKSVNYLPAIVIAPILQYVYDLIQ